MPHYGNSLPCPAEVIEFCEEDENITFGSRGSHDIIEVLAVMRSLDVEDPHIALNTYRVEGAFVDPIAIGRAFDGHPPNPGDKENRWWKYGRALRKTLKRAGFFED